MTDKKLYRNTDDALLAGVCSGIAEFFGIDKTLVRLLWALLTIFTAIIGGTLAYVVCWLIIPPKPATTAPQVVS